MPETLSRKISIPFGSLFRALFERVQNVDSFRIFRQKAAKQIGLTIPPNVLARADRVIR